MELVRPPVVAVTVATIHLFDRLLDDAAIFPPGNAPMAHALLAHELHENSWYAATMGPFVCSGRRWPELTAGLRDGRPPLATSLVVTGGLAELEPAVALALAEPRTVLRAVEVPITYGEVDAALRALDLLPAEVRTFVELPFGSGLAPLQSSRHKAKFRTADGPGPGAALAQTLLEAARRRVPFKLTGGLHHAVATPVTTTSPARQGFLNVLTATAAALEGRPEAAIATELAEYDGATLTDRVRQWPRETMDEVRALFTSFGTCSVAEPLEDLVGLGLLP